MNSWLIVEDLLSDLIKKNHTNKPAKIVGIFQPNALSNQIPIGRNLWNLTDTGCQGIRLLVPHPGDGGGQGGGAELGLTLGALHPGFYVFSC